MTNNTLLRITNMNFGQNVVWDTVARIHSVNISSGYVESFPVTVSVDYKEDTKIPIWKRPVGRYIYELHETCTDFFELCDALINDDSGQER